MSCAAASYLAGVVSNGHDSMYTDVEETRLEEDIQSLINRQVPIVLEQLFDEIEAYPGGFGVGQR